MSLMVRKSITNCSAIKYMISRAVCTGSITGYNTSENNNNNNDVNKYTPSCRHCVYMMPKNTILNKDNNNKCVKFKKNDMYSGFIIYDSADSCREDKYRCGEDGKEFIPILAEVNRIRERLLEKVF